MITDEILPHEALGGPGDICEIVHQIKAVLAVNRPEFQTITDV